MGCCSFPKCMLVCKTTQYLCLILLCFLVLMLQPRIKYLAEGRREPKLVQEASQEPKVVVKVRSLIGSRPPRCERRCGSCGRCEAVQVPIVPRKVIKHEHHQAEAITIAYSRGDGISNYKPMCWKCKCGDFIFNP